MRTLKYISIIGIFFFIVCIILISSNTVSSDIDYWKIWTLFGILYAIVLAAYSLIQSMESIENDMTHSINQLNQLYELKEKKVISEEEFNNYKAKILEKQ